MNSSVFKNISIFWTVVYLKKVYIKDCLHLCSLQAPFFQKKKKSYTQLHSTLRSWRSGFTQRLHIPVKCQEGFSRALGKGSILNHLYRDTDKICTSERHFGFCHIDWIPLWLVRSDLTNSHLTWSLSGTFQEWGKCVCNLSLVNIQYVFIACEWASFLFHEKNKVTWVWNNEAD